MLRYSSVSSETSSMKVAMNLLSSTMAILDAKSLYSRRSESASLNAVKDCNETTTV